jgi:hypothetical protein
MAFALTEYKAYGIEISEPIQKRAVQVFECTITGTTADVALDIGDVAGTAWTSIDDNALGLAAKVAFTEILSKVARLAVFRCPELEFALPVVAGGAATTGKYGVTNNTAKTCPKITLYTGEGLTSYKMTFMWTLANEMKPVRAGW